jgi:hypothetical protein
MHSNYKNEIKRSAVEKLGTAFVLIKTSVHIRCQVCSNQEFQNLRTFKFKYALVANIYHVFILVFWTSFLTKISQSVLQIRDILVQIRTWGIRASD